MAATAAAIRVLVKWIRNFLEIFPRGSIKFSDELADEVAESAEEMKRLDVKLRGLPPVLLQRPVIDNLWLGLNQLLRLLGNHALSREVLDDVKNLMSDAEVVIEDIVLAGQESERFSPKVGSVEDWWAITDVNWKRSWKLDILVSDIWAVNARFLGRDKALPLLYDGASGDSEYLHPMRDSANVPMMVGIEDAAKEVISRLLEREKKFDIVSICGMSGIGKTTLAQKIFRDTCVRGQFDCVAWASVGDYFETRQVLEDLLMSVTSHKWDEMIPYTDSELAETLYGSLQSKKYLLVLDDVWEEDAWECLRLAFPKHAKCGRLIITTRSNEVGYKITAPVKGFLHHMKGLTEQQSWELFYRTASRAQTPDPRELAEVAEKILGKCFGLPLAVKVLGGLFAARQRSHEWKVVEWRMADHGPFSQIEDQSPEVIGEVTGILTLSYEFLPSYLKPCFLYFAMFPKGTKVKPHRLIALWLAEGLIVDRSGKEGSLADVAQQYLNELCSRNLVLSETQKVSSGKRIKSCHLHDLIHDLCLLKQKEENFSVNISSGYARNVNLSLCSAPCSTHKIRRLSLHFGDGAVLPNLSMIKNVKFPLIKSARGGQRKSILSDLGNLKGLRSLLLFPSNYRLLRLPMVRTWKFLIRMDLVEVLSDLGDLKGLRLLDCNGFNFNVISFKPVMKKLVNLRYLSLTKCHIENLPSTISSLSKLETLCLDKCTRCRMVIPKELQKLSSLRHLFLPHCFEVKGASKLRMDGLINLVTLVNFDSTFCELKDLGKLTKLGKLSATIDLNVADLTEFYDSVRARLKKVRIKMSDNYSKEMHIVFEGLCRCPNLQVLHVEGVLGSLSLQISYSLTKICFSGSKLGEDPMGKLEKLPNLKILELHNNAFVGKCMACSVSGMPLLRSLTLLNLDNLERLAIRKGGMPDLVTLALKGCQSLKDLPEGLTFLRSLQELEASYMPSEFMDQLNKAEEVLPKEHVYIIKTNELF